MLYKTSWTTKPLKPSLWNLLKVCLTSSESSLGFMPKIAESEISSKFLQSDQFPSSIVPPLNNRFCQAFKKLSRGLSKLADESESFNSKTILGLLRSAPDLLPNIKNVEDMYVKPASDKGEFHDTIVASCLALLCFCRYRRASSSSW